MSYDPKCRELAEYFLQDRKNLEAEDIDELAQEIQDTVETFFPALDDIQDVE